jgi:hypothetical protein
MAEHLVFELTLRTKTLVDSMSSLHLPSVFSAHIDTFITTASVWTGPQQAIAVGRPKLHGSKSPRKIVS